MLVRQFLVQEPAVHGQSTTFIVAAGNLLPDDDMPGLAFGTGERADGRCRKAEVQDFAGGLACVVRDGSHESLGRERVPLDLQQGLFPASRQGDIRHKHLLYRLVDMQPLFRGDDALARSGDVVALEQGGNDGGSRGGRSDSQLLHGLPCLLVGYLPAAGFHGRQQRGFGIERSGHGLLLGQSVA